MAAGRKIGEEGERPEREKRKEGGREGSKGREGKGEGEGGNQNSKTAFEISAVLRRSMAFWKSSSLKVATPSLSKSR